MFCFSLVLSNAEQCSQDTVDRIRAASIEALPTDQDLVIRSDYILSIVPPRDALATARRVQEAIQLAETLPRRAEREGATPKPYFFDLNAISPRLVREIAALFSDEKEEVLAHFLDGGIIGGPPSLDTASQTWKRPSVVISGSVELPATFSALAETLNMKIVGPKIGSASVLKLSFASLTKGLTALTILSFSTAQAEDVLPQLLEHLHEFSPRTGALSTGGITGMAPKAYRWVEEMRAIGEAFESEGHWDGVGSSVYGAFAEVYRRVAEDTVLGEEKVGQRRRGQTAEDVASIVAAANINH
jgi:3-hydroxyisobutyrate dehydrogenase-like beta-hydroxyacid dehydrogenase